MATLNGKAQCVRCGKERCTSKCSGCSKEFCRNHFDAHHQESSQQLDEIEANRNAFRESISEQMKKLQDNPLIQQINTWERDSIKKIKETAEEAKELLIQHMNEHYNQIEVKLNKLTNQLKEIREENDFNEVILRRFQDELIQLNTQPMKLPTTSIRPDSRLCITDINTKLSGKNFCIISVDDRISDQSEKICNK